MRRRRAGLFRARWGFAAPGECGAGGARQAHEDQRGGRGNGGDDEKSRGEGLVADFAARREAPCQFENGGAGGDAAGKRQLLGDRRQARRLAHLFMRHVGEGQSVNGGELQGAEKSADKKDGQQDRMGVSGRKSPLSARKAELIRALNNSVARKPSPLRAAWAAGFIAKAPAVARMW